VIKIAKKKRGSSATKKDVRKIKAEIKSWRIPKKKKVKYKTETGKSKIIKPLIPKGYKYDKETGIAKKRKQTLFKPPKYQYLADLITYKSVEGAERSSKKAMRMFNDAKSKQKKLRIVRTLQYAENRINASLKKKSLNPETKKRFKKISSTYGFTADSLWIKYSRLK